MASMISIEMNSCCTGVNNQEETKIGMNEDGDEKREIHKTDTKKNEGFIGQRIIAITFICCLFIVVLYIVQQMSSTSTSIIANSAISGALTGGLPSLNLGIRQDYELQDCRPESSLKHSFPDLDYFFKGYNIFEGYPLTDNVDPGFTHQIFKVSFIPGRQTADCRYSVPEGIELMPALACRTDLASSVIKTQSELQSSMGTFLQAGGGYAGFSCSANANYKQESAMMSSGEIVIIRQIAKCNHYQAKLDEIIGPDFSDSFKVSVKEFAENLHDAKEHARKFVDYWGTHYFKNMIFGASFVKTEERTVTVQQQREAREASASVQASGWGFSAGAGGSSSSSESQMSSQASGKVSVVSIGAPPPADNDGATWAASAQRFPVPIKYEVEVLSELFREDGLGSSLRVSAKDMRIMRKTVAAELESRKVGGNSLAVDGFSVPNFEIEHRAIRVITTDLDMCRQICGSTPECFMISHLNRTESNCYLFGNQVQNQRKREGWNQTTIVLTSKMRYYKADVLLSNIVIKGSDIGDDRGSNRNSQYLCLVECRKSFECVAYTYFLNETCRLFRSSANERVELKGFAMIKDGQESDRAESRILHRTDDVNLEVFGFLLQMRESPSLPKLDYDEKIHGSVLEFQKKCSQICMEERNCVALSKSRNNCTFHSEDDSVHEMTGKENNFFTAEILLDKLKMMKEVISLQKFMVSGSPFQNVKAYSPYGCQNHCRASQKCDLSMYARSNGTCSLFYRGKVVGLKANDETNTYMIGSN